MEEEELFEKVCQPRLERIEKKLDSVCDLLRGKNSEPGIVDDVRLLKKVYKCTVGVIVFVVSVIVVQIVTWIRQKVGG